jgi:hypothetical protein
LKVVDLIHKYYEVEEQFKTDDMDVIKAYYMLSTMHWFFQLRALIISKTNNRQELLNATNKAFYYLNRTGILYLESNDAFIDLMIIVTDEMKNDKDDLGKNFTENIQTIQSYLFMYFFNDVANQLNLKPTPVDTVKILLGSIASVIFFAIEFNKIEIDELLELDVL